MSVCGASPIVLDNGSCVCKIGYAGDDEPKAIFSTVIGRPRHALAMVGMRTRDHYVGANAQKRRGILCMKYPMQNGIVTNWDDMQKIWSFAFYNKLRVNTEDHPLLITEPPQNAASHRERIIQFMFEDFNIPAIYVVAPAVLSLYAMGRTTGIVYDSGDGVSHVIPVFDGYAVPIACKRVDFAGSDVTNYLSQILTQRGYTFVTSTQRETVRDIKEKLCLVSLDFEKNMATSAITNNFEVSYELPDGQIINIGNERFRAPEIMFSATMLGRDLPGMHTLIHHSIMSTDEDIRKDLFSNIVLSGGNTLFEGMIERLHKEMAAMAPPVTKVRILAPPERQLSPWVGGSIVASLSCFRSMCLSKKEYDEAGPSAIHRKCF